MYFCFDLIQILCDSSSAAKRRLTLSSLLLYERVFRMLPGYSFDCPYGDFTFDPRVRPWYVGASSGPKDVIIVLDTSGSMNSLGRMVSY